MDGPANLTTVYAVADAARTAVRPTTAGTPHMSSPAVMPDRAEAVLPAGRHGPLGHHRPVRAGTMVRTASTPVAARS